MLALAAMFLGAWLMLTSPYPADTWLGGLVVNGMGLAVGIGLTLLLLDRQVWVRCAGGTIEITRWLTHLRGQTPEQSISVASLLEVRLAWPLTVTVIADKGSATFGTFWWRPSRYREFERLMTSLGLKVTLDRAYPGRNRSR